MSEQSSELTIVFADVAGSTRLYEQLGDQSAQQAIAECIQMMSTAVLAYSGRVIKTIGDEIMCCFPSASVALDAALRIQADAAERRFAGVALMIRIGAHHGPVIEEKGDVFGDAVNLAARMAGLARGGQIIVTGECLSGLKPSVRNMARHVDQAPLKGKAELVDVFEILPEQDGATHIMQAIDPMAMKAEHAAGVLTLSCGGDKLSLANEGAAVIGRSPDCDLVVPADTASRQHARIEYRRGKFLLVDQSTNGTFVRFQDGQTLFLKREESPLWGAGQISLGDGGFEGESLVQFRVTQ